MRTLTFGLLISSLVWTSCGDANDRDDELPASASSASRLIPQVMPPLDIKKPPEDAEKTSSGLAYKKLTASNRGALAQRGDTVLVHYTGWRQRTGETFFTTRGISQPMALDVAHASPGFSEGLQLLHKGEKAVLWVPPNEATPEPLVYEIEVIEVVSPPKVAKQAAKEESSQTDAVVSARSGAAPSSK
jgi:hypothetical protein